MFLRSSNSGGRTSWTVVESYREGRWAKHRTIYKLGTHATREAAQAMWEALVKLDEILAESKIGRGGAAAREELSRKVARALRRASGGGAAIDEEWLRARVAEAVAGGRPRRPRATPRAAADGLAVLGLGAGATVAQVKAAYRRKAVEIHPDRGGSHEAMAALNNAYEAALRSLGASRGRPPRANEAG
ncbi:J domain-containing protein [Planctomyces sp. SH-PL62]|uniref:J domain-containing protein n=1 Tax=Planctomyces sp. SH-PL62 TaxID=1636152 RepID=UPI00078B34DA|nr:J domain-containing protein [Planctomyces sp. SH-PL62]AMV40033.1 DnaJ domain protein [Planctomyces sp. SH-PL62]